MEERPKGIEMEVGAVVSVIDFGRQMPRGTLRCEARVVFFLLLLLFSATQNVVDADGKMQRRNTHPPAHSTLLQYDTLSHAPLSPQRNGGKEKRYGSEGAIYRGQFTIQKVYRRLDSHTPPPPHPPPLTNPFTH